MRVQEVARFESAGDVRTVSLVQGDDGLLEVRELREGPSVVAVYGEGEHSLRVLLAPEAVPGLLGAMAEEGVASVADYLASEDRDIVDLMDLCDRLGVAYSFVGIGEKGDIQYRPAHQQS